MAIILPKALIIASREDLANDDLLRALQDNFAVFKKHYPAVAKRFNMIFGNVLEQLALIGARPHFVFNFLVNRPDNFKASFLVLRSVVSANHGHLARWLLAQSCNLGRQSRKLTPEELYNYLFAFEKAYCQILAFTAKEDGNKMKHKKAGR